jgi:hypothetical protein
MAKKYQWTRFPQLRRAKATVSAAPRNKGTPVNVTSNEYKNSHDPHVNITMPVFNRHDLTVASILSVNNTRMRRTP